MTNYPFSRYFNCDKNHLVNNQLGNPTTRRKQKQTINHDEKHLSNYFKH